MKKTLLILMISISCVLKSIAQTPPIDLYRNGTNTMVLFFNDFCTFTDSVGGPNTPYEGNEQLVFSYNFTNYYAGGGFAINNWWYHDFTGHTDMVVAVKGTANTTTNTLSFIMEDTNAVGGAPVVILNNSNTASYQLKTIPLSSFKGTTAMNLAAVKVMRIVVGNIQTSAGKYFIDNIQIVDNSVSGIANKYPTVNIFVSPNPSSGIYTISSAEKIDAVTVSDNLGRVISNSSDLQIDLTNHPDGLYFVTVLSGEKRAIKKLIKK